MPARGGPARSRRRNPASSMTAPMAPSIQERNPVTGSVPLVADRSPLAAAVGEELEATWLPELSGAELLEPGEGVGVGAGAGVGAVFPAGDLPAKGSVYCSSPALWPNAAAGSSRTSPPSSANARDRIRGD